MRHFCAFFILIALAIGVLPARGEKDGKTRQLIEKYRKKLSEMKSARDSVTVLYNIFDLEDTKGAAATAWILHSTAGHINDLAAQTDMLCNLAVFYARNDSMLREVKRRAALIPNKDARNATLTFISNQQFLKRSNSPGNRQYEKALLDSINSSHDLTGSDKYDKLSLLYQMIHFLGTDGDGALFREIFEKYSTLVRELPPSDYPLKNQYYLTASLIYTRYKERKKAIDCDLKLLEISEQLRKRNVMRHRVHRNYDVVNFRCYERILNNFKALSPQQIEAVHDSMLFYYNKSQNVRDYSAKTNLMNSVYLFATKQYKEAIPELKKSLEYPAMSDFQKVDIYDYIAEAAKATGDTETRLYAMEKAREHINLLDSIRKLTAKREIELRNYLEDKPIFYGISSNSGKTPDHRQKKDPMKTPIMVFAGIVSLLLLVYMNLYFKLRTKRSHRNY